ncbi:MAG: Pr6Pr family membrane protein [Chitinophagales bacterium]
MNRQILAAIFKIFIAIIAWFALVLQLFILINNTPGNGMTPLQAIGRFFIFFTILSNLLVAVSLAIILIKSSSSPGRFFSKPFSVSAIAVYIFIVGLVYNIILRPLWRPTGLQWVADELLHVAVPVLFLIYWVFLVFKGSLKWKHAFWWLIFPLFYLFYAMIRGKIEGFYPYPFIDLNKLGYSRVLLNCAGLTATFLIIGLLFVVADKIMGRYKTNRSKY